MMSESLPPFRPRLTRRAALTRLGMGGLAITMAARQHGTVAQAEPSSVRADLPPAVQAFIAGWETLDVEQIVGAFAADAVLDDVAAGVVRPGQAAIRDHVTAIMAAFDDLRVQVFAAIAAGNLAALEWTLTGRYTGILPGLPPGDGQAVAIRGAHTLEVAGGRIQLAREYSDVDGLPRQLGLVPPTAGYVGWVDDTEALLALVTDGTEVRAYVCDGRDDEVSLSEWFRGTTAPDGAEIDLPSTSGQARLTATVTPAAVTGMIEFADQVRPFNVLPARYRAGLYAYREEGTAQALNWTGPQAARAKLTAAGRQVEPSRHTTTGIVVRSIGGWVVLNSTGEMHQRGAVTVDDLLMGNTTLDVATRLATLPDAGQVLTGLVTSTNVFRFFTNGWP